MARAARRTAHLARHTALPVPCTLQQALATVRRVQPTARRRLVTPRTRLVAQCITSHRTTAMKTKLCLALRRCIVISAASL